MKIELGSRVKDTISGFTGICVARTEWLNGCVRITIAPEKLKEDGGMIENGCFDQEQVEVLAEKRGGKMVELLGRVARKVGGDRPSVGRNPDPRR